MVEELTSFERRNKRLRENYLRKVAERDAQETSKEPEINIAEQNADPAIELIEKSQDIDQVTTWLAEESQGKKRKTVIEALEAKMAELEGDE